MKYIHRKTAACSVVSLLVSAAVCRAQALKPFDRTPAALHRDASAKSAAEQRAWEDAVFAQYAVPPAARPAGKEHAAVRLDTLVKRMYRTRLREAMVSDDLFAGSVGVTIFGCGTGCASLALADQRTGASTLLLGVSTPWSNRRVVYRPGSRALLVVGEVGEKDPGERWYVWTGSALCLVRFEPLPDTCFALNDDGKLSAVWNSAVCHWMPPENDR